LTERKSQQQFADFAATTELKKLINENGQWIRQRIVKDSNRSDLPIYGLRGY